MAAETKIRANSIANFDFPDQAVSALEKYFWWKKAQEKTAAPEYAINPKRQAAVSAIIKKAADESRKALTFAEAKKVMDLYQISTVEAWNANDDLNNIKFPVVIKVDDDKVLHKTDKKALILNIQNQAELQNWRRQSNNDRKAFTTDGTWIEVLGILLFWKWYY